MNILKFTARRLLAMAVILLIVSFLVFGLLALTPGDPAVVLLGPTRATPEAIAKVNEEYGLDRPFVTQYLDWVTNAVTGDFGTSIRSQQPVTTLIGDRVGVTASLAIYAFIITLVIAVPFGLLAGSLQGSGTDRAATTASLLGLAIPSFAVGFLMIYVFAVRLEWFPAFGSGDGFWDRAWHLTLPAIAMAISQVAIVLRQTRAATVDVNERDFVTFAMARAVPRSKIWTRYTLHNASLPVLTAAGLVLAYSLTGAVLIENVFALQGLGTLLVTSVAQLDLPVVQALAMFTAVLVLVTNLIVDVLYFVIDPRLRRSASQPA